MRSMRFVKRLSEQVAIAHHQITALAIGNDHLGFEAPGAPSYPEEKLQEIQAGHLAHLGSMADSGDLVIAGPIEDGADLRGILIFRSDDRAHIEELATQDPAIQAGRLKLELHRWIVPEGSFPES